MTATHPPRFATARFGIVVAAVVGFGIGATGFATAQHGDSPSPGVIQAASPSTRSSVDDGPSTSMGGVPSTSVDDGPSTSVGGVPSTSVDDGPSTSVSGVPSTSVDDGPSTSMGGVPSTSVDDGPSTSIGEVPTTSIGGPSTTNATSLPAPFTTSYASVGGSINITWSGTAFTLNSVSPSPGFGAEIEDQSWDRVRVDFDGEGGDARIEVRINDGQLRVGID